MPFHRVSAQLAEKKYPFYKRAILPGKSCGEPGLGVLIHGIMDFDIYPIQGLERRIGRAERKLEIWIGKMFDIPRPIWGNYAETAKRRTD